VSKPIQIGERIGIIKVLLVYHNGERWAAECECDCGVMFRRLTSDLRRTRGAIEVSCGCLRRAKAKVVLEDNRKKRSAERMVKSGKTLKSRTAKDPSPWEIAEECLQIHIEADRQPPEQLVLMLEEFRKKGVSNGG
jgi:hypothetical protein